MTEDIQLKAGTTLRVDIDTDTTAYSEVYLVIEVKQDEKVVGHRIISMVDGRDLWEDQEMLCGEITLASVKAKYDTKERTISLIKGQRAIVLMRDRGRRR